MCRQCSRALMSFVMDRMLNTHTGKEFELNFLDRANFYEQIQNVLNSNTMRTCIDFMRMKNGTNQQTMLTLTRSINERKDGVWENLSKETAAHA